MMRDCFCVFVVLVCARFNVCVSFVSYCVTLHGLCVLCAVVCWCMRVDVFLCFVCGCPCDVVWFVLCVCFLCGCV